MVNLARVSFPVAGRLSLGVLVDVLISVYNNIIGLALYVH